MDDELHKLRENLPPTDDQALASAMNAHAARTVCVLNALSASVEARLAEAARGVAEADARTRLLERALDAESGETTTSDADARVEAVSWQGCRERVGGPRRFQHERQDVVEAELPPFQRVPPAHRVDARWL